ncbi:hypothetical protein BT96DRAFT_947360 [Gymnopus androsaceus JB14]|uniref:Protein kinase domain-containing protein n=1 Tax=Gymnopus androsaceus JB14 TaxID=1447944 RepID=A0A6A4GUK0_9AGAR|nr:hypothetical protein BT96DRAFT_947360 [Gymnopus androsaceus JB14]
MAHSPQFFPAAHHINITGSFFNNSHYETLAQSASQASQVVAPPISVETNYVQDDFATNNKSDSVVYARFLMTRKRGYPLWRPKDHDSRLPDIYKQDGVHIGDVGILDEFGGFDYLFNACHPADHPLNEGRVPETFKLLEIDHTDTREYHKNLNQALISKVSPLVSAKPLSLANLLRTSNLIYHCTISFALLRGVPEEVAAGLAFTSSARNGALLILPEGGKRTDHRQRYKFEEYAVECARSWYAEPMARGMANGALYLVTGFDKARAWGVASFIDANPGSVSLEFIPKTLESNAGSPKYWFRRHDCASASSGADNVYGNQSGCVFLRGFKIAVRNNPFTDIPKYCSSVKYISDLGVNELFPRPTTANLPWHSTSQQLCHASGLPSSQYNVLPNHIYHPSDVINRWVLNNHDEVEVSITHDDDWASVIEDDEEELPSNQELIRRIRKHLKLVQYSDITTSTTTPVSPSLLGVGQASDADFHKFSIQAMSAKATSGSEMSSFIQPQDSFQAKDLGHKHQLLGRDPGREKGKSRAVEQGAENYLPYTFSSYNITAPEQSPSPYPSSSGDLSGSQLCLDKPHQLQRQFQMDVEGPTPWPSAYYELAPMKLEGMVDLSRASRNTIASDLMYQDSVEGSAVYKPLIIKEEGAPTHFRLGNSIGSGQFGSVYRALNLNTGQMVAVKRIQLEGLEEEEVAQLVHELDLVKKLSHPSIIKYEGIHRDADTLSIVLEYAENGSLDQTVKEFGKLDERLVASYVVRILEGLHYLHKNDVIHRNLKAANILTTKNGNVKLSDIGGSLNLSNWVSHHTVDIPNNMPVMSRTIDDDMPPIPPGVSPLLEDFLRKCFHKDPAQRPTAELLFDHDWLKQNWGGYKEVRRQDSIPFFRRRISADLQKSEAVHYLSQIEMPEPAPEHPQPEDFITGSPPGRIVYALEPGSFS